MQHLCVLLNFKNPLTSPYLIKHISLCFQVSTYSLANFKARLKHVDVTTTLLQHEFPSTRIRSPSSPGIWIIAE